MTMSYLHRCMIVPEFFAPMVRMLCNGMAPDGSGSNMFSVALSESGDPPEMYFISAGPLGTNFCHLLPLTTFDAQGNPSTTPGQSTTVVMLAAQAGIAVTLEQIEAIFAAVEVTEESWESALERKALKKMKVTLP